MFLYYYLGLFACLFIIPNFAYSNSHRKRSAPIDDDDFIPYEGQRYDTFDWQLLKALESPDLGNVIVSPLSVKLALAMLYEGATGSTKLELEDILELPVTREAVRDRFTKILASLKPTSESGHVLNLGTNIYLDSSLTPKPRFVNSVKSYYDTDVKVVDFNKADATATSINLWIKNITNGKIKDIVSADDLDNAVLLLVNALYFKGQWRYQFPRNRTTRGGFYTSPQQSVTVWYMINSGRYYYSDSSELDAKILRLPFKDSHFSMYLVLPNTKTGLNNLIWNMNPAVLKRHLWLMDQQNVEVILPKFKFDFTSKLGRILQKMGLQQIFQNTASLHQIASGNGVSRKLVVSNIFQKAGIEVNEEGSVAYAATEIILGNKFGVPDYIFNASNPFLFFIEDELTGTVLFAGKVENPVQAEPVPFPDDLSTPNRFGVQTTEKPNESTKIPVVAAGITPGNTQMHLNPTSTSTADLHDYKRFYFFDIELFKAVASKSNSNILISPASIKQVLAMVLEGAVGQCAEELRSALRLPHDQRLIREHYRNLLQTFTDKQTGVTLELANKIFISDKATPVKQYQNILNQFYYSDVESVNFSTPFKTANHINEWVNNATHGLIPTLLNSDSIRPESSVILSNALYFKGLWEKSFSEQGTQIRCFQQQPGQCYNTYMMDNMDTFNYGEIKELDAKALELPYKDNKYSMLLLLPNKLNGIKQLIRDLPYASIDKIVDKMEMTEVLVAMPRFQIEYSEDMARHLEEVYISEIFSEQKANLSGIVNGKNDLYISNVLHKTKIEVNEQGTIAAASTGAVVIPLMGSTKPRFRADHPFVFFIRHMELGTILFAGRVSEPEKATVVSSHGSRKEQIPQESYQQNSPVYQPAQPLYTSTINRQGQGQQVNSHYNTQREQPIQYQSSVTYPNDDDSITYPKKN